MAQIMIVDDSVAIRMPLKLILEELGHDVNAFEDGRQALDFARGEVVDLVITDLNMPVMNGMALIASLRKNSDYSSVPILVLTTETVEHKKNKAKTLGATGWIAKPFSPERIKKALEKTLPC